MIRGIDSIEKKLLALEARREKLMQLSRELIRLCGKTISAMHSGNMGKAAATVRRLRQMDTRLKRDEKGLEYYSLQAHQEYCEAMLLYYVLKDDAIASPKEIGIGDSAYLLGLMDLVGELKREALDELRKGSLKKADRYYGLMLDIYDSTLHMRFSNSLLPDFRKKQDVARIQIEGLANELSRQR